MSEFLHQRPTRELTFQGVKGQAHRLITVYRSIEPVFTVAAGAGGSAQRSMLVFMPISAFIKDAEKTVNSELANL